MTVRRYRFNEDTKQMEEVGAEWTDAERLAPVKTEEIAYGGLRATDGTDISSRKKRADYMRRNNLTDPSDFKSTWDAAQQQREAYRTGKQANPELRQAIGRIEYEASKRKRR